MRFKIRTRVPGNYIDVMNRFDRDLFEFLLPSNADVELKEFTGSTKGSQVHLEFKSPVKGTWISDIVEHGADAKEAWFVDVGTTLPFGLKFWRHRHSVRKISATESEIVDDISFKFANGLLTTILFPGVYLGFLPRRSQYKRYFAS